MNRNSSVDAGHERRRRGSSAHDRVTQSNAPHDGDGYKSPQIFLTIPYNASRFVLLIVFQFRTLEIGVSSQSHLYNELKYCLTFLMTNVNRNKTGR